MKSIALILPLLALAACSEPNATNTSSPVAAVNPPPGTEWVTTVSATPDGGFVMGNPKAPIKLVEYASLSCSHCAEFSEKASEPLKSRYVSTGKVSYELRNYVRDPLDMTVTLVARCGGPGPFFPLTEQLYTQQAGWFEKMQTLAPAEQQAIAALPTAKQFGAFAQLLGLEDFARQRGLTTERLNACFVDNAEIEKLVKMRDRANSEFNLQGTPTFLINGQTVPETATWELLEPKLKAAGA